MVVSLGKELQGKCVEYLVCRRETRKAAAHFVQQYAFIQKRYLPDTCLAYLCKGKIPRQKVVELLENDGDNYQTGNHRPSVDVKVQHITLVNGVAGMELE